MNEATPKMMLGEYRIHSDQFTLEQAKLFADMIPHEQAELLFMMQMHTNYLMHHLHGLIDPRQANPTKQ